MASTLSVIRNRDRGRILVIDDEPGVIEALVAELGGIFDVVPTTSAGEAIDTLREGNFDAMISDMRMPDADGVELLEQAHAIDARLVRILLTGYSDAHALKAAQSADGIFKLRKPWGDELEITLRRAIEHRRSLEQSESASERERKAREQSEMSVRHLDKLATIGTLSAGIVHELRSPLGYLSVNLNWLETEVTTTLSQLRRIAELAIEKGSPADFAEARTLWQSFCEADAQQEFGVAFDESKSGLDHVASIIEGLRSYVAPGTYPTSHVNLHQVVQQAQQMVRFRFSYNVAISVSGGANGGVAVDGRAPELLQIILNLLVNAMQATGDGGEVKIRLRNKNDRARVEVEDSGPGVADHHVPRLFEPFYTTKGPEEGTGLGLSISRTIAQQHGGELSYQPAEHGGALFVLDLPLARRLSLATQEQG